MKHFFKLIIMLVLIFSFFPSSFKVNAQTSGTITDPSDDVGQLTYNSQSGRTDTYKTVTTHPDIDILSASYTKNENGSATLKLTVKGTIVNDVHTFYKLEIIGNNTSGEQLHITSVYGIGYAGGQAGSAGNNIIPDIQYEYKNSSKAFNNAYNFSNGNGPQTSYTKGSVLMVTLGNNITASTNENSGLVSFPAIFPASWNWHITTWQGNNSLVYEGSWYLDYYPQSDNKWTNLPLPITPGFDLISIISFPVFVIILRKLKKNI